MAELFFEGGSFANWIERCYPHLTTEVLCCKVLIFITAVCVCFPSLCSPCGVEPHPSRDSLMSAGERGTAFISSISTDSEQGCQFSSPIGVG